MQAVGGSIVRPQYKSVCRQAEVKVASCLIQRRFQSQTPTSSSLANTTSDRNTKIQRY